MSNQLALEKSNNIGPWIAFVRIFLGAYWLYEVAIGNNWKTGSFTSGPNPGWIGPEAGAVLIEEGHSGMEAGGWAWFGWILENFMYPQAALWGYFAIAVQFILAFAFLFGIFARPIALLGLGMDFFIFMIGNSRIPPFFSLGHLFVLATNAGIYYGVDAMIMDKVKDAKTAGAKLLKSIYTFDFVTPKIRRLLASIAAVLAVYYLLKIGVIETEKIKLVSMDLAVLFGFIAYGLFVYREKMDKVALTVSLLRIWLGYRFMHEIFVRWKPALNGLPGWGNGEQLTEVFKSISEKHWGPFSTLVDALFIPMADIWGIIFAIVQTTVAIMLLLGIKTRLASKVGLAYLSLLIIIGFTRYSPFVFGYLFAVLALDGGRMFSFDSMKKIEPKIGIRLSNKMVYILLTISLVSVIAANIGGINPNGYQTSMGPVMAAMVSMLTALVGLSGAMQNGLLFWKKSNLQTTVGKQVNA
ncbi:MAG: hypothetical protein ACH0QD_06820 [Tepidibacillus sp.]